MAGPQVLIGGEWLDGADGGYEIINPATEEVVGIAPEASEAQALDAARAAQEAFPAWSQTSPEVRANLLQAVADAMKDKFDELMQNPAPDVLSAQAKADMADALAAADGALVE